MHSLQCQQDIISLHLLLDSDNTRPFLSNVFLHRRLQSPLGAHVTWWQCRCTTRRQMPPHNTKCLNKDLHGKIKGIILMKAADSKGFVYTRFAFWRVIHCFELLNSIRAHHTWMHCMRLGGTWRAASVTWMGWVRRSSRGRIPAVATKHCSHSMCTPQAADSAAGVWVRFKHGLRTNSKKIKTNLEFGFWCTVI